MEVPVTSRPVKPGLRLLRLTELQGENFAGLFGFKPLAIAF